MSAAEAVAHADAQPAAAVPETIPRSRLGSGPGADWRPAAQAAPEPQVPTPSPDDEAIVRLVSVLFEQAMRERRPTSTSARFPTGCGCASASTACCGGLRRAAHRAAPLMSRVKVLAGFDVGRTASRQGHFSVTVEDRVVDVRIAILPTGHDESCVLRIIDRDSGIKNSTDSASPPISATASLARSASPWVGGGERTDRFGTHVDVVAHACALNMPERSIATVEDPVSTRSTASSSCRSTSSRLHVPDRSD